MNQYISEDAVSGLRAGANWQRTLVLTLLISFPSFWPTQKFLGLWFIPVHILATALVVHSSISIAIRNGDFFRKRFCLLATATFLALLAGYLFLHPFEDGRGPLHSSDRDEALALAASRMLHGQYPYYQHSDVAGPLSSFPGSIILAAPFILIGDIGLQNIFWLIVFLFICRKTTGDDATALWLLGVPLLLSPAAIYEWISGGDLIANGIFVAVALVVALQAWSKPSIPTILRLAGGISLGVALASRANFLFLLPIFGATIVRVAGWRMAILACLTSGLSVLAVTLPFYLADPSGFTPLMSRGKISSGDPSHWWIFPTVIALMTAATALASAFIARSRSGDPIRRCLAGCAIITLVPNLAMVAIGSLLQGCPDFGFTRDRFGLMYVFLALLAWPPILEERREGNHPATL